MAISRLSIVKFLELALVLACIGIHYNSFDQGYKVEVAMLITGTYVGYLIILIGGVAGYLMQTPINSRIDIFFSLLGVTLFVSSGALIIEKWQDMGSSTERDRNLAKAALSIINGAVFLADAVFTQRGG